MKPTTISLFSFLLVSLVLLGGCDRGEPPFGGSISGQIVSVMDQTTPVPFSKVVIYYVEGLDPLPDSQYWIAVDSTISDQNGEFSIEYEVEIESPRMFAKGYQEGYMRNTSPTYFGLGTDSIQVLILPVTYFKVHIEDEYPFDYSKYVGMQVYNTSLIPIDTIFQYPLDTTVVISGSPAPFSNGTPRGMAYSLVYDRPNTIGSSNYLPIDFCPPFDTCEIWIKF